MLYHVISKEKEKTLANTKSFIGVQLNGVKKGGIIDDMSFTWHMLKKVGLGPLFVLHGNAQTLFILMNIDMANVSNRLCLRTSGSNLTVDGWFVHCWQQWHVSWV